MSEQLQQVERQLVPINMGSRGFQLRTMDEAGRLARCVAVSELCPPQYRGHPEAIVVCWQYGAELGLPPMMSLANIMVVNGRPALFGPAMLALCRMSAAFDAKAWREQPTGQPGTDTYGWSCTCGRKGETPITRTFTVAEAKRAKLWGKNDTWTFYPERMLMFRARAFALRDAFPEVLMGMSADFEVEDLNVEPSIQPTTTGELGEDRALTAPPAKRGRPRKPTLDDFTTNNHKDVIETPTQATEDNGIGNA
jgi:hypothetical protein